jgi:signal peptidase II
MESGSEVIRKAMNRTTRLLIVALVIVSCVLCDQATKAIARRALDPYEKVQMLGGVVRFQYVENPGAFLSMGAGLPDGTRFLIFVVFVGGALAATLYYAIQGRSVFRAQLVSLALIAGGGIGNLIDRIVDDGGVVDFMSMGIGPVRTGIFNVADMAIMAGMFAFLIFGIRKPAPVEAVAETGA